MRDEMLKRLDEIIATAASVIAGADCGRQAIEDDWPVLRAELAAEHCENCRHFTRYQKAKPWGACSDWDYDVAPDFCCAHFEPKAE